MVRVGCDERQLGARKLGGGGVPIGENLEWSCDAIVQKGGLDLMVRF